MRLLFVYQFLTHGGVEMVMRNRVRALRRLAGSRVQVTSLFLADLGGPRADLGDELVIGSSPEVIAEHMNHADVISIIDTPQVFDAAASSGKPVLIEAHSPYDISYLKAPLPPRTRLVLVPSVAFKTFAEQTLGRAEPRVACVSNPIDDSFFNPAEPLAHVPLRAARPVLWVGRLDDMKNWREAARVFRRLIARCPGIDLELFIVGGHPTPKEAFAFWKREGVLGHVRYLPFVPFESMPALYRAVAAKRGVYLSTSKGETFGMTAVEAMAAGLPCVLTALPALREVSAERATYYSSPNIDDAARGLEALLKNDDRYAAMSRELTLEANRFHPDQVAPQFLKLIETMASPDANDAVSAVSGASGPL